MFVFNVMTSVLGWYGRASSDGQITSEECTDLLNTIARAVGQGDHVVAHVKSTGVAT